ncbi:hypothetical protein KA012_02615 [Candidatus Woesebacteria bacterium]|nr:hypothetical protein [Candidatus Woesebacteria bacterium]
MSNKKDVWATTSFPSKLVDEVVCIYTATLGMENAQRKSESALNQAAFAWFLSVMTISEDALELYRLEPGIVPGGPIHRLSELKFLSLLVCDVSRAIELSMIMMKFYTASRVDLEDNQIGRQSIEDKLQIWRDRAGFATRLYAISLAEEVLTLITSSHQEDSENNDSFAIRLSVLIESISIDQKLLSVSDSELEFLKLVLRAARLNQSEDRHSALVLIRAYLDTRPIILQYFGSEMANKLFN